MWQGMKSVMVFNPQDTDEQTATQWMEWTRNKRSSVADRAVPNAEDTRKYLRKYDRERII